MEHNASPRRDGPFDSHCNYGESKTHQKHLHSLPLVWSFFGLFPSVFLQLFILSSSMPIVPMCSSFSSPVSLHLLPLNPLSLSPSAETEAACIPLISTDIAAIDQADYQASCSLIKEICVWFCTWAVCVCVCEPKCLDVYVCVMMCLSSMHICAP